MSNPHGNSDRAGNVAAEAAGALDRVAPRHAVVIFNPTAGWRRRRRLDAILALLRAAGLDCAVAHTGAPGDAERLARAAAAAPAPPALVIAAGGAGPDDRVERGLAAAAAPPPPLAILPLGTANVLAAEIGLEIAPPAIAAAILAGRIMALPLGRVVAGAGAGRCFLLMAGAGFDAHVVEAVRPATKRLLGKGAYVLESGRQMFRFGFPRYRVTVDGVEHDAASVIVARGRLYGGRHLAAPAARLDADEFQICLFEDGGRLAVLRYGIALLLGRLPKAAGYRMVPGRRIRIAGPDGDPVQADGDIIARLPLTVELAPRRLQLIVP